jgi:serine/threonine protein kinase
MTRNALVESVKCRRILLARKTINCRFAITTKEAFREVQHLQKLRHSHIVRVVGTYVMGRQLSILLYPVADYNLADFMDLALNENSMSQDHETNSLKNRSPKMYWLHRFFHCLGSTVQFLHDENLPVVKHMDIKPENLLVRHLGEDIYKIYLADFGIARSYDSVSESETDSPTAFTRKYAAPEVIDQRPRGLPADIFSLGCVFAEMLGILAERLPDCGLVGEEAKPTGRWLRCSQGFRMFSTNLAFISSWLEELEFPHVHQSELHHLRNLTSRMLEENPAERPKAVELTSWNDVRRVCCVAGQEPFQIYDESTLARPTGRQNGETRTETKNT